MAHYAVEYGITRHPLAFLFCSFSLFFPDIKCGSTTEIADHLGVSVSSLNRWVKQFDSNQNEDSGDQSRLFRGSGNYSSYDAKELARLRKENKDLKDAIEVLKKAMRIVSSQ